jgi:hypothetical protein
MSLGLQGTTRNRGSLRTGDSATYDIVLKLEYPNHQCGARAARDSPQDGYPMNLDIALSLLLACLFLHCKLSLINDLLAMQRRCSRRTMRSYLALFQLVLINSAHHPSSTISSVPACARRCTDVERLSSRRRREHSKDGERAPLRLRLR